MRDRSPQRSSGLSREAASQKLETSNKNHADNNHAQTFFYILNVLDAFQRNLSVVT